MQSINYGFLNLNDSDIVISDISHEDMGSKEQNFQRFAMREGGNFAIPTFNAKRINMSGHVKKASKALLEAEIDRMKKFLNYNEQNLDIEYSSGTRRYIASCTKVVFKRAYYTIDYIEFSLEFTVSNPPFGTELDTSTLEYLGKTSTFASTMTGEHQGVSDFNGSFHPYPIIRINMTAVDGLRSLAFRNTDEDGKVTATTISGHKFYDGDIILINTQDGTVTVNGVDVDFQFGLPAFSLSDNRWTLDVVAISYNIDVKFIYYPLWI